MSNHELYAIPDPMIGHQIGRYVIRRKLAEGGMGAVYLATHERLENTTKVIKILLPVYARNPILRERFEREALAVSRMRHKHIVTIDDYGQLPDGQLFLMMPFLQGQSLETYLHGAQEAERQAIMQALAEVPAAATPAPTPARLEEVLTFEKWFHGRFWTEWVIAQKNKPSEVEAKESIYRVHLGPAFGHLAMTVIDFPLIARFRAKLIESGLSDKRINNILAVLSKALNYAEQAKVIPSAPSVGMLKVERPEIVAWSLEEYARLLAAAKTLDPMWYAASCLAGEAGLRIGEVRELDWRRDVDLVAGTLTVNKQTRREQTTTPKGRTRRTVPMTETLIAALKALETVRTGYVIRNLDGTRKSDNETKYHCYRICRAAGLPERGWHILRHAFGTHAAMFGVNPWKLMKWMGHKRIDETMLYVEFAEVHMRPIPAGILAVQRGQDDPDRRVFAMLSARKSALLSDPHCSSVAARGDRSEESALISTT